MADTTISGMATSVTALAGADLFECEQGAVSKKITAQLMQEFMSDKGVDVASAGTLVLGAGELFHITGTTTITDIDFTDTWDGRRAMLIFDGILTLTHNATSLILPGGANLITCPGDSCWIVVDSGDNVKVISFERATGAEDINPRNVSIAGQAPAANATTYITDSNVLMPPSKMKVRTTFYWRMVVTKTAAGTAAKTILVKLGTAGTTSDATLLTFTLPAGTAVIDDGVIEIFVTIRGPLGASCIAQGHLFMTHRLAEVTASELTGLIVKRNVTLLVTSSAFDSTTANLIIGIAFTAGVAEAWTFSQVIVESNGL
jgi:hypothetical protein